MCGVCHGQKLETGMGATGGTSWHTLSTVQSSDCATGVWVNSRYSITHHILTERLWQARA